MRDFFGGAMARRVFGWRGEATITANEEALYTP
jgi:hypothetical protein